MDPSKLTMGQFHAILRSHFPSFIQKCFYSLAPNASYLPNWHIEALAYHLELIRMGKLRRLIVNMPPRSLKSIIGSVALPAFMLGHDPTKRLICVSYGSDLATKHANDCRATLNAAWFRSIFPGTRISRTKNTESEVLTTRNGYRLATSIDGTLTGRGGDIIIIDDPLKPSDALSDSKRERVNDWYNNTLLSRLDDKQHGSIVVIMQRLHMNDLAGTLLRASDEWTLLKFPAIAEEDATIQIGEDHYHVRQVGDLLHAEREPLQLLEEQRAHMGSDTFQAQYQQEPVPPGGNMIKRGWVQPYDQLPVRTGSTRIVQSWDTASKEGGANDWSVCTTWLFHDRKYYLIDVCRERLNYPALKAKAIQLAGLHDPMKILIEDTGVGTGLIAELQQLGLRAIAVKPEGNKLARMSIQSAKFEARQVFFPKTAPWLAALEAELFSFPGGRHDDQIDSISQALAHITGGYDTTLSWVG
jgi:predicted phage terminase large subunit-like protein